MSIDRLDLAMIDSTTAVDSSAAAKRLMNKILLLNQKGSG